MQNFKLDQNLVSRVLKQAIKSILLPNVLLVILLCCLNWIVVGIFMYWKWEDLSDWKKIILLLYGGSFPVISYSVWALRRSAIKFLLLIYDEVLIHFFRKFLEDIATGLYEYREKGDSLLKDDGKMDEFNLVLRFRNWLKDKIQKFPNWIQKLINFVLRKMSKTYDFQEMISEFEKSTDSRKKIQLKIEEKVRNVFETVARNLIPGWTNLLLVLNVVCFFLILML